MSDVEKLNATDERKEIIRHTIARIAIWVKGRKLGPGALTEHATDGFNLACDFLSHELMVMQEYKNKDILND